MQVPPRDAHLSQQWRSTLAQRLPIGARAEVGTALINQGKPPYSVRVTLVNAVGEATSVDVEVPYPEIDSPELCAASLVRLWTEGRLKSGVYQMNLTGRSSQP